MFKWIRRRWDLYRAHRKYKKQVRKAEFDRTIGRYEYTQNCKHAIRVKIDLGENMQEVECLECGLIKILRVPNK